MSDAACHEQACVVSAQRSPETGPHHAGDGDGDYEPVMKQPVADGFAVAVLYWSHASRELREAATVFHALDRGIADLALH